MLLQWRAICCRTSVSKTPEASKHCCRYCAEFFSHIQVIHIPEEGACDDTKQIHAAHQQDNRPEEHSQSSENALDHELEPWMFFFFKLGIHHGFFKNACGSCKLRVFGVLRVLGVGTKFSICSIQPNKKRTPIQSCRGQPSCSWKILNFSKRTILRCNGERRLIGRIFPVSGSAELDVEVVLFNPAKPGARLGSYSSTADMPSTSINSI